MPKIHARQAMQKALGMTVPRDSSSTTRATCERRPKEARVVGECLMVNRPAEAIASDEAGTLVELLRPSECQRAGALVETLVIAPGRRPPRRMPHHPQQEHGGPVWSLRALLPHQSGRRGPRGAGTSTFTCSGCTRDWRTAVRSAFTCSGCTTAAERRTVKDRCSGRSPGGGFADQPGPTRTTERRERAAARSASDKICPQLFRSKTVRTP